MLIKCPECGSNISDKSEICVHCGFPISKMPNGNICIIDGVSHDLTEQLNNLNNPQYQPLKKFGEWGMSIRAAYTLHEILKKTHSVPRKFNSSEIEKYKKELPTNKSQNIVRCPKCNSTSISTGARGVNLAFGLIGASKTVNRCAKCGYTWKP